jgi:DNA-binding response OmpR family regulator
VTIAGAARGNGGDVDPSTALVVDDDDCVRTSVAAGLADRFDRVLDAPSAELALYLCGQHAVDVVATSSRLPGMTADDLCLALADLGGPPVVAYGADGDGARRARWLDDGGADCMAGDDPLLVAARCRAVLRRSRRTLRSPAGARTGSPVLPGVLRWR